MEHDNLLPRLGFLKLQLPAAAAGEWTSSGTFWWALSHVSRMAAPDGAIARALRSGCNRESYWNGFPTLIEERIGQRARKDVRQGCDKRLTSALFPAIHVLGRRDPGSPSQPSESHAVEGTL